MAVAELFRALGDPTRLEMVSRLADGTPHTITSISSGLEMSRQGARKHLQILVNANVIILQPKGRDTDVLLDRNTLEKGKVFIAELEQQWDKRLKALREFVDDEHKSNTK